VFEGQKENVPATVSAGVRARLATAA
jgi:hypothetical protein